MTHRRDQKWRAGLGIPALETTSFALDERAPADLISLFAEISRRIGFDDGSEVAPGGFGQLWHDNVAFLLAEICQVDAKREYSVSRRKPRADLIKDLAKTLDRIDGWHQRARGLQAAAGGRGLETALTATLHEAISRELAPAFAGIAPPTDGSFALQALTRPDVWQRRDVSNPDTLDFAFSTANRTTGHLVDVARDYLHRALTEKSDHAAHAGLVLGVLDAFQAVQSDFADLTERHLLYHYKSVLQILPRPAVPDRAVICFELAKDAQDVLLPQGTRLLSPAKGGDGPTTYQTRQEQHLSTGRLARQVVLRMARDFVDPRDATSDATILRNLRGGPNAETGQPWPPFGSAHLPMARLGLQITDPVLRLETGRRSLGITLEFDPDTRVTLSTAYRRYKALVKRDMGRPLTARRFFRIARQALKVTLGGQDLEITALRRQGQSVRLEAGLAADAPAVTDPVVTVELAPEARVFMASALEGLVLKGATLDVAVADAVPLNAVADGLPVALEGPIAPFTAVPRPGMTLDVALPELVDKKVSALGVNLAWAGLPGDAAAWQALYAPYEISGAQDFKLDVFPTGQPALARRRAMFPMRDDGSLLARAGWDLSDAELRSDIGSDRGADAGPDLSRGLTLKLAAPKQGFGQDAYPGILARAATPKTPWWQTFFKPPPPPDLPPQPPYPMMQDLRLSYRAQARVAASGAMDLLPLFEAMPLPPPSRTSAGLAFNLPDFDAALYLGFEALAPGRRLSMLVEIEPLTAPMWRHADGFRRPALRWWYSDGHRFIPLQDDALRADGTRGLVQPGLIDILLPIDLAASPLAWIAATIEGDPGRYGRIKAVHLRAVEVERLRPELAPADPPVAPDAADGPEPVALPDPAPGSPEAAPAQLAAGRIRALAVPVAGIKGLVQPMPSQGGRPAEREADYRQRLSGRLHHRQRAIRTMDFERLVLDAFPEISQVKAINSAPGEVTVVVAPQRTGPVLGDPEGVSTILRYDIRQFLKHHASSQVQRIIVTDPLWEKVAVQAMIVPAGPVAPTLLGDIDRQLLETIAPWLLDPTLPLDIGTGEIRTTALQASIEARPDVAMVESFGILHSYIQRGHDDRIHHGFKDTARGSGHGHRITCATPLSVLVPERPIGLGLLPRRHGIGDLTIGQDLYSFNSGQIRRPKHIPMAPRAFGIGRLRLGTTFIPTDPDDVAPQDERQL